MAEQINDSQKPLRLISPLQGELAITNLSGTESLGRLFEFQLELISTSTELSFDKIVGQNVTIEMDLADGTRYFNGFVTDFRYVGGDQRYSNYQATVRPWFWFLTRTADCRIFQKGQGGIATVPDIIKSVFADNGMSDFDDRLTGDYRDWIYCVQYRESDFNFISRLMEQEGIYYYFLHENGKHTLVLADHKSGHEAQFGCDKVPYCAPSGEMSLQQRDHLQYWTLSQSMQPAKYAIEDFDFEKPKVKLLSKLDKVREFANPLPDPEIYDYPGEFMIQGDGDNYVERRLQELQCQHERVQAAGPCRTLTPGALVELEDHPRADQNKKYLVLSITHSATAGEFGSGGSAGELYNCNVELLDETEPYRSSRVTPKPVVQGCQTAMVVGPSSEEIYCDEYGRVKVQFHWDRYGTRDENSSCWIRVSQIWAGGNWGSMHIPRIGQEVIVSFLEGDPDQPIITGRVYNAESMPVYSLEGNKTQSGIKSRSTPGGGANNFNEIRFEDKMGSEQVYIQAEKDEEILVKNDKSETVGHDETIDIGNDRTENVGHDETRTVGHDETVTVQNNRTDTVVMDETRSVLNNRTRTVAKNESVTVTLTRTHMVGVNESITVGGAQEITVGGMQSLTVAGVQEFSVGASREVSVIGGQSEEFRSLSTETKKDWSIDVGNDYAMKAKKKINIDAGDELVLKCGAAKIIMKKSGDITISGKNIKNQAKSKIDLKANATIKLKGASVKDN